MTAELKMPALSPSMEKGTLARWLVGVGDTFKAGDVIAEIETDKATMELEAEEDGRIAALLVEGGRADVKVGATIALLAAADDDALPQITPALEAVQVRAEASAMAALAGDTAKEVQPADAPRTSQPSLRRSIEAASSNIQPITAPQDPRATPLTRRLAGALGIDLATITGTGPRGKIISADLGLAPRRAAVQALAAAPAVPAEVAIAPPPIGVPAETRRLTEMRKTIARRLTESKQQVPHFYLTARCQLDPLLTLRAKINADLAATGVKLSVNDMLIKAMARAMMLVPEVNVQFGGESIHHFQRVDISMAVAIDGGLVTPVLRDVGVLSLSAIAAQSRALAEKARAGQLKPEDWQGGTASISNLGMFGIDEMFPVINPPQALILGVAAGVEQPWKVDGQIALATIMAATASFDHRVIDGATAARFMAAFRDSVEAPLLLLC